MSPPLAEIIHNLQDAEIMAILNGQFSLAEMLEIGDALLAAPILALEISLHCPNALSAINEIQQRAQGYMLVGAGAVDSEAQLEAAVEAGAHFTVSSSFNQQLLAQAQAKQWLHLPTVSSLVEAEAALMAQAPLIKTRSLTASQLSSLKNHRGHCKFLATGGLTLQNLVEYVQAGVTVFGVETLVQGLAPNMADIITRSRQWSRTWRG